jgi:hypothetical protein
VAPFVVVGNGPPDAVRGQAAQTIAWARDLLKRDFFERDPGVIVTVWVFHDDASYLSGVSAIFGSSPSTPYGYYRPCDRALIVNAGNGYGTLVHELVHAYMDANFSEAPTWFNEGLASLYEQSSCVGGEPASQSVGGSTASRAPDSPRLAGDLSLSRERTREPTSEELRDEACLATGHIHGESNWRLPGLKDALARGRAPSWESMAHAGRGAFNGESAGLLYATSRYLLYWLQEKSLLVPYFRAFRSAAVDDDTGLRTLAATLDRDHAQSLAAHRQEWEAFVLALH